ncbi:MAG: M23 family metallopeptidase [Candidatus Halalkalibacterium sp. M3_1C_030]
MPINRFVLLLLCWILPVSVLSQNGGTFSPDKATYIWPTNAGEYMSSTFGETRSAHFHSALDLKTWGRKGYEVYATRDGILHRIAIGPTGYGKVLYLKHDDGSYSVYAHLLRFNEKIQQIADSMRFQDYSFEIDRNLESLNYRIKQGEIIALSGASGIGPPHLHFELRTPDHRPFNPLLTNLAVKDNIAPQFSNLSIEPLSIESEVEGSNRIFTKRVRKTDSGYSFGTVDVSGPVGLGVDVFDQANDVHNAYAVYELKMYLDDELRFHSKVDSFSYEETNQMFVDRVYPILKEKRTGFQRLYIADGNTLPFYKSARNKGKIDLEKGTYRIKMVAADFFGNTSEAVLRLRVNQPKRISGSLAKKKAGENKAAKLNAANWTWFENWVNIPRNELSGLTVAELDEAADSLNQINYENKNSVRLKLNPARDIFFRTSFEDHFIARQVTPGSFSIVPSTTDKSYAAFQAETFYDTLSVGMRIKKLRADSTLIELYPSNHPIKKAYKLAVEIDSSQRKNEKLGIYNYEQRREKFSYLDARLQQNYLVAEPEELGSFYILEDTKAPELSNPRIIKRVDGHWLVYVTVRDNLSGLDYNKSEFYINGTRGIAEYEPEDNRLVYYHPDFVPEPENEAEITVYDMEGNKTEKSFTLSFDSGK